MFYRTCPHCGCNLDPSESCDCQQERKEDREIKSAERGKEDTNDGKNRDKRA